ncbi:MAG: 6-hydroxymethylpterin diphosphokinase MptE-like protein, partial [Persicimonas sp.]
MAWYERNRRDLPWRGVDSPYAVWVSEVMLQQTRVETVIDYFRRWMQHFPTVESLADAEREQVMELWSGLGYYRRARFLHESARLVVDEFGGELPRSADDLEDRGIRVDWMVTDLDKNPETVRRLAARGPPVAVHAHGDNLAALASVVPECPAGSVLPTTQAEPRDHVMNVGGFTDGDRAAFLADHLGAADLAFVGWDLNDPLVDREKARKLEWAERLLYWL